MTKSDWVRFLYAFCFCALLGDKMYMNRIRLCGVKGGGRAGRGHPGKNAGKLEEKCIKMITSRTKELPSWDRVWEKEMGAGWLVGKVLTD